MDVSDIHAASVDDKEVHFLSRSLAAFSIAELAKVDDRLAAESVVDEQDDDGIDAFYFDREEHICYVIQSKWVKSGNGSIDVGSVLKFSQGVTHLLSGNDTFLGPKLRKKTSEIQDVLADSRATFVLVICYTGQQPLSAEAMKPLDELLAELNDEEELVSLRVLRQKELHRVVAQHALGESVDFSIMLHEYGVVREPYRSYYGQVDAADIVLWSRFGDHLYDKNIRGFKGSTDVNDGIVSTIKNNPENLLYFNNGITILCSQLDKQPLGGKSRTSGVFDCKGASVVNGAQTVGSIIAALTTTPPVSAPPSRVMVRLISLQDCPQNFGVDLTRAANTQNRIEKRDFAALDEQQGRLRTDLLLSLQKEYVYRTGDKPPSPDSGCTLDEATVALACAQTDVSFAMTSKREVSKLYEDIKQAPYTILFNSSTTPLRLWRSVEVMRAVDVYLKQAHLSLEGKSRLIAIHGNRVVLYLVFRQLGATILNESIVDVAPEMAKIRDAVANTLGKLVTKATEMFPTAYPSNLFKNITKCKALINALDGDGW
ncbi:MAG: AIPR family protein [Acidobacteriia bacterium]|nr:AIPR family protein [Terriglobia bacterium]